MSITELTTASAWVVGLAIVSLIATGWRKPARATARPARARRRSRVDAQGRPVRRRRGDGLPVVEATVPPHHGTPLWRRIWAVVASTVLAVVSGALIATVVAVGLAFAVVTLTDMLKR